MLKYPARNGAGNMDAAAARRTRAKRRLSGEGSGRTYRSVSDEADVRDLFRCSALDSLLCRLQPQAGRRNGNNHATGRVAAAVMRTRVSAAFRHAITARKIDCVIVRSAAGGIRRHGDVALMFVCAHGTIRMTMPGVLIRRLRRVCVSMRRPAKEHGRRGKSLDGNRQHRQVQHDYFEKTLHPKQFRPLSTGIGSIPIGGAKYTR